MPSKPCLLFDPAIVCCPACKGTLLYNTESLNDTEPLHNTGQSHNTGQLQCASCQRTYPVQDGIPVLLENLQDNTRLDHQDYDDHHGITDTSRQTLQHMWQTVFAEHAITGGIALEIGCGTGQLTAALSAMPGIDRIHATDISLEFLQMTANLVGSQDAVHYYACDANRLPFHDNGFDVIVGNSVLHHLLDYPIVLAQCAQLLKPGGTAVFFEPVLQGKIMIAFLADLMLRIHQKTGYGTLTDEDRHKIARMVTHITKSRHIGHDRDKLATMEDKYVFDVHELKAAAVGAGFSQAFHRNNPAQDGNYRFNLHQHLRMAGIDEKKIGEFRFLMNAAHEMFIEMTPRDLITPMGFFIFRK